MGSSRRASIVIVGLLLLVGLAFGVSHIQSNKPVRLYTKATSNLKNAWVHNDSVYFFSGSLFGRYSLTDDSVTQLSDYLYIASGITAPSWSENSVVFKTNPALNDRDDTTTAAANLGTQEHRPHWWRYDFASKQYQLLGMNDVDDCATIIQMSAMQFACSKPQTLGSYGSELVVYTLGSSAPKTLVESDDSISGVSNQGTTIYFKTTGLSGGQTLHSVTGSEQSKTVYTSKHSLNYYAYSDGSVVVNELATSSKNEGHEEEQTPTVSEQKLILVHGTEVVMSKKIKSLPITLYTNKDGAQLFSSLDGSIKTIENNKIQTISKATKNTLKTSDFLFKSGGRFFVLSSSGTLSAAPKVEHQGSYRSVSDFNVGLDNDQEGRSFISEVVDGSSKTYLLRTDLNSSEQEKLIGSHLYHIGYRPHEFNFLWVLDANDTPVTIEPIATVIR